MIQAPRLHPHLAAADDEPWIFREMWLDSSRRDQDLSLADPYYACATRCQLRRYIPSGSRCPSILSGLAPVLPGRSAHAADIPSLSSSSQLVRGFAIFPAARTCSSCIITSPAALRSLLQVARAQKVRCSLVDVPWAPPSWRTQFHKAQIHHSVAILLETCSGWALHRSQLVRHCSSGDDPLDADMYMCVELLSFYHICCTFLCCSAAKKRGIQLGLAILRHLKLKSPNINPVWGMSYPLGGWQDPINISKTNLALSECVDKPPLPAPWGPTPTTTLRKSLIKHEL